MCVRSRHKNSPAVELRRDESEWRIIKEQQLFSVKVEGRQTASTSNGSARPIIGKGQA